jgi:hypothetical protein
MERRNLREHTSIHIISRQAAIRVLAVIITLALAAGVFAHGGAEHIKGTVAAVSDTAVTVKTTEGKTVVVNFGAKTTFSRASHAIQKTDLKPGDRVVIHAEKDGSKLVAETIEAAAGAPAKPTQQ